MLVTLLSADREAAQEAAQSSADHLHPALDLDKYLLERGHFHIRPEYLEAAADHLGKTTEQTEQHAADLTKYLRVAVHAPRVIRGRYRPATEDTQSAWKKRLGEYSPIVEQRRAFEDAYGLVRDGKRPVSGVLMLHFGDRDARFFDDGHGIFLCSDLYGDQMHLLYPVTLDRTLLFTGDSQVMTDTYDLEHGLITPKEAALLLTVPNLLEDTPYLEGMVLGGVNMMQDSYMTAAQGSFRHIP